MKKILLRSCKSPFDVVTHEQGIQRDVIATNAGNLIFSDATHKLLLTGNTEVVSNRFTYDPSDAGRINEEYDAFVIPLANAFRPSFEGALKKLTRLIQQLTIPVTVLGVGAQTGLGYDPARLRPIEDSVKRFVSAVLDRSPSIGVRGEFTEQYLGGLGFSDVDVIGCPSMFMNGGTFEVQKRLPALTADSRIAVNASHSARGVGDVGGILAAAHARYPRLLYVAQNLVDAELLYWGDLSEASDLHHSMPVRRTHPLFRENKVRVFLDPITWIEELRAYDFSFGTRIHGNIAALLAGTPATVLCHDSRTLELCRYFDIPYRMISEVPSDIDPAVLYEEADFGRLTNGHKERWDRFTGFLDRNGLDNVYDHGDGGAAFDARMRGIAFPPGIQAWDGHDDGGLGYRISWLRDTAASADRAQKDSAKRIAELTTQLARMEKRLGKLEARAVRTTMVRAKRAVGRPVRRMLGG